MGRRGRGRDRDRPQLADLSLSRRREWRQDRVDGLGGVGGVWQWRRLCGGVHLLGRIGVGVGRGRGAVGSGGQFVSRLDYPDELLARDSRPLPGVCERDGGRREFGGCVDGEGRDGAKRRVPFGIEK